MNSIDASPLPASQPSQAARRLTLVMCIAETLGMAGFALFAALLPEFQSLWDLDNTEAGWIGGGFFLGYMLAVPVLTGLTDRHDARLIYLWAMLLTAFASAGFVLADDFWSALLWRVLAGVGLAGTYMPGLKALSERIEGPAQSRAIAFYTASFGLGTALSFLLAGELAALGGWQLPALLSGGCALFAWVMVWRGLPPKPVTAHEPRRLLDLAPLTSRPVIAYCLAYAMHNLELFAFRAWLVAFIVFAGDWQGQSPWLSGTWVAMIATLIGMPASIIGNEMAIRFGRQRWLVAVMLISAVLACLLGLGAALPFWALLVLIVCYSVTVTADSAALTAGLVAVAPTSHRGAVMALYSCTGFTGAFLGPLLFGMVLDALGDEQLVGWWAAFALMGLLLVIGPLALRWASRRSEPQPELQQA
ncbi:MFS transporter [Pseudomonas sp. MTM4]|uniref:MFS transporter n=1 Tax=unclassified Pseudomonas TaxID=196821 RepID=UPI0018D25DA2|nr:MULTISPECIES: MFS transporter [unclassified Pseudomonas]MBC8651333.1 MFS transporter [Pseudomonas sp. MT4]QXY91860.1 MFS transporter [Pseudomonas sp. MTM4]